MEPQRRAIWPWLAIAALATLPFFWAAQRAAIAWAPGPWLSTGRRAEVSLILAERAVHPQMLSDDLFLLIALLAASGGYGALLLHLDRIEAHRRHLAALFAGAVALSICLWFVPFLFSGDVYSYAMYGRIAVIHGGNPFVQTPAMFPGDPFSRWVVWKDVPSVYGPVWIWTSSAVTWIAELLGGSLGTYVLLYKGLATSAHLASGACIAAITGRIAPRRRLFATALYLLNPLALIEFSMNAHNDSVMLLGVLAGIYISLRPERWSTAFSALAFAAAFLTKWTAGVALVVYGVRALQAQPSWRARVRTAAIYLGALLAIASTYIPFWQGADTFAAFDAAPSQQRTANSLGDLLLRRTAGNLARAAQGTPVTGATGPEISDADRENLEQLFGTLRVAAGAIALAALLAGLFRVARGKIDAVDATGWILFAYCATALWFWPWYATWILALGALPVSRGLGRAALVFSLSALLTYVLRAFPYRALIVIGLPLAWAVVDRARQRHRDRPAPG